MVGSIVCVLACLGARRGGLRTSEHRECKVGLRGECAGSFVERPEGDRVHVGRGAATQTSGGATSAAALPPSAAASSQSEDDSQTRRGTDRLQQPFLRDGSQSRNPFARVLPTAEPYRPTRGGWVRAADMAGVERIQEGASLSIQLACESASVS